MAFLFTTFQKKKASSIKLSYTQSIIEQKTVRFSLQRLYRGNQHDSLLKRFSPRKTLSSNPKWRFYLKHLLSFIRQKFTTTPFKYSLSNQNSVIEISLAQKE